MHACLMLIIETIWCLSPIEILKCLSKEIENVFEACGRIVLCVSHIDATKK